MRKKKEEKRHIRMVGHYSMGQVQPKDCIKCRNARFATVLVNGVCLDCRDKAMKKRYFRIGKK